MNKRGITSFTLKIAALICMVIDHAGSAFFPEFIWMRIIGRLSFPIFAWMIAQGYFYTKDFNTYLLRLIILAVISQIPYSFLKPGLTVIPTLIAGIIAIHMYVKIRKRILSIGLIALLTLTVTLLGLEYGGYGVLMILFFYIYREHFNKQVAAQILTAAVCLTIFAFMIDPKNLIYVLIQPFSLLALPLIYFYNGKQGIRAKYLFYVFYPLQFFIVLIGSHLFSITTSF